jgi:hypothetical protein
MIYIFGEYFYYLYIIIEIALKTFFKYNRIIIQYYLYFIF